MIGADTRLIQGDCLEVMKDIPDNSVDAVITDPLDIRMVVVYIDGQ
jgi:DNA modification methylase